MLVSLVFALACTSPSTSDVTEAPSPEAVAVKAPSGTIGGQPILPKPMVMGGIDNQAVEDNILKQRESIEACYTSQLAQTPGLRGKVLIKFTIDAEGKVSRSNTRSTSLRNETVETCINEEVAKTTFPALKTGRVAIVQYPFVFPMP